MEDWLITSLVRRYFQDSDYFSYEAAAEEPMCGPDEKLIGVYKRAETDHIIFTTGAMTVRNDGGLPVRIPWNSLCGMEPPEKRFAKGVTLETTEGNVFVAVGGLAEHGQSHDAYRLVQLVHQLTRSD